MICQHCGKQLNGDEKFCPACGTGVPLNQEPFEELTEPKHETPQTPPQDEAHKSNVPQQVTEEPKEDTPKPHGPTMYCRTCGAQISVNAYVCPKCGVKVETSVPDPNEGKAINYFGLVGMIIGILSIWLGVYFCVAPAIGLTFSIIGMARSQKCRLNGFAIAGLALNLATIFFWALIWLFILSVAANGGL